MVSLSTQGQRERILCPAIEGNGKTGIERGIIPASDPTTPGMRTAAAVANFSATVLSSFLASILSTTSSILLSITLFIHMRRGVFSTRGESKPCQDISKSPLSLLLEGKGDSKGGEW